MDKKIKEKWVKALLSGEYKQGKHMLRDENDNFCCLGVLCDLHAKETGNKWNEGSYMDDFLNLPSEVRKWADLESASPSVHHNGKYTTLTLLNDGYNMDDEHISPHSFEEIAKIIDYDL